MKLIDLIIKIANKEINPGTKFKYYFDDENYEIFECHNSCNLDELFVNENGNYLLCSEYYIGIELTNKVEIIEDKPEKIEKIMQIDTRETRECIIKFQDKINEIIDKLNYLLEKRDKDE